MTLVSARLWTSVLFVADRSVRDQGEKIPRCLIAHPVCQSDLSDFVSCFPWVAKCPG